MCFFKTPKPAPQVLLPEAPVVPAAPTPAAAAIPLNSTRQLAPKKATAGSGRQGTDLSSLRKDLLIPVGLSDRSSGINQQAFF